MAKKKVEWDPTFGPYYTPEEMLKLGVFEGKYINGIKEVPAAWKKLPKVVGPKDEPNAELNHFKVKSRQPLSTWKKNGWIFPRDPEGWFAFYIKYYLGMRDPEMDKVQIARWRSFVARHQGQINANCKVGDKECRPRQRQGLLQWAWNSDKEMTDELVLKNAKRMAKLTKTEIVMPSTEIYTPPSHEW